MDLELLAEDAVAAEVPLLPSCPHSVYSTNVTIQTSAGDSDDPQEQNSIEMQSAEAIRVLQISALDLATRGRRPLVRKGLVFC